jgi:hypothetical protein
MKGIEKIIARARVANEVIVQHPYEEAQLPPGMRRYQFADMWESCKPKMRPDKSIPFPYLFGTKGEQGF